MVEKNCNGMEQFEGFEKLKKMKNGNGMGREKWVIQTYQYIKPFSP